MNKKIEDLTKEEIKRMLIVSVKNDAYSAKCFANLILESEESIILEKFIDLLSCSKRKEAIELITNNY